MDFHWQHSGLWICKKKRDYCMLFAKFSLILSPSGKLVQIEYALNAVAAGAPSVGIKGITCECWNVFLNQCKFLVKIKLATNGVVLATEKKQKTSLHEDKSVNKVEVLTSNVGVVYSGMGPDYRLLVKYARKLAEEYKMLYDDSIPTVQLVRRIADVMQEYTQSGYWLVC